MSYLYLMKLIQWDKDKNTLLTKERDISFEVVLLAITEGHLLNVIPHPNQKKYPGQKIWIVEVQGYVYLVPFVEDERSVFLKTIIPSRRATKEYKRG